MMLNFENVYLSKRCMNIAKLLKERGALKIDLEALF